MKTAPVKVTSDLQMVKSSGHFLFLMLCDLRHTWSVFTFFTWLPRRPSLPPHGVLLSSHLCWFLFIFPNSKYWAGSSLHSIYPHFLGDLNSSHGFKGHLYSSDPLCGCLAGISPHCRFIFPLGCQQILLVPFSQHTENPVSAHCFHL